MDVRILETVDPATGEIVSVIVAGRARAAAKAEFRDRDKFRRENSPKNPRHVGKDSRKKFRREHSSRERRDPGMSPREVAAEQAMKEYDEHVAMLTKAVPDFERAIDRTASDIAALEQESAAAAKRWGKDSPVYKGYQEMIAQKKKDGKVLISAYKDAVQTLNDLGVDVPFVIYVPWAFE